MPARTSLGGNPEAVAGGGGASGLSLARAQPPGKRCLVAGGGGTRRGGEEHRIPQSEARRGAGSVVGSRATAGGVRRQESGRFVAVNASVGRRPGRIPGQGLEKRRCAWCRQGSRRSGRWDPEAADGRWGGKEGGREGGRYKGGRGGGHRLQNAGGQLRWRWRPRKRRGRGRRDTPADFVCLRCRCSVPSGMDW